MDADGVDNGRVTTGYKDIDNENDTKIKVSVLLKLHVSSESYVRDVDIVHSEGRTLNTKLRCVAHVQPPEREPR